MSALPPKADMLTTGIDVRFVPIADVNGIAALGGFSWHEFGHRTLSSNKLAKLLLRTKKEVLNGHLRSQ